MYMAYVPCPVETEANMKVKQFSEKSDYYEKMRLEKGIQTTSHIRATQKTEALLEKKNHSSKVSNSKNKS